MADARIACRICRAKGETPMNCRTDKSMYAPNETVCVYVDGLPAETVSLRLILLHLEKTVLTEEIAAAETAFEPVISLQTQTGESGLTLEGMLTAGGEEEGLVERLTLRAALEELPQREKQVLLLRYYRGMTQMQTARVVGVSQVQVSRLERRALERLRQELAP